MGELLFMAQYAVIRPVCKERSQFSLPSTGFALRAVPLGRERWGQGKSGQGEEEKRVMAKWSFSEIQ